MTRGKLENPFSLSVDPASIPSVDEVLRRVEVGRDAGWLTPDTHEVLLAEEVKRLRAEVTTVTSANARLHDQLEDLDAEVERLRAVCAAQQEAVDNLVNEKNVTIRGRHSAEETQLAPLVELERLRAENAELREGFKVIREMVKEARAE